MNPRNAILFFIILAVVVVGSLAVYFFGKKPAAVSLPPPPSDNYTAPQNNSGNGSSISDFFSSLFTMPSFNIPAPEIPVNQTGSSPVAPTNSETGSPEPILNPNESPLKGKIYFSYRNTPAYAYDYTYGTAPTPHPEQEYITIQSASNLTGTIRVTGLILKSIVTNNNVTIGTAAYLPFPGTINANQDIFIGPNERVVVITGKSPLGFSFRLNECTGYFSQHQTFYPSLPIECPYLSKEPLPPAPNNINDQCLDKIDSFGSCRTFTEGDQSLTPECNNFLVKTTTYNYCIDNHKSDPNFYDKEWRVYLGRSDYLWKSRRETIELIDQDGKIVDTVTY